MTAFPSPTAHNQSSLRHESMEICAHASAIPALSCQEILCCPAALVVAMSLFFHCAPDYRKRLVMVSVPQPSRFGRQERFFCPFQDGTERIKKK